MANTVIFYIFALILAVNCALARFLPDDESFEAPEKKSYDSLTDFTSALNGAARLRYGKRFWNPYGYPSWSSDHSKRSQFAANLPQFIQNLNGAERLRFGRK
uniref:Uncharacterized protein n=1 Tax=Acrobeloides nanus TaxID=290746 RepID=A0A914CK71_9BILA